MCMQENTAKFKGKHMPFLHLYKLPFPSVSQSVRPLVPQFVCLSVHPSVSNSDNSSSPVKKTNSTASTKVQPLIHNIIMKYFLN